MTDIDEQAVSRIVTAARTLVSGTEEAQAPDASEPLEAAVRDAAPDDRSAAAKELAGDNDQAALDALHEALRTLAIEP